MEGESLPWGGTRGGPLLAVNRSGAALLWTAGAETPPAIIKVAAGGAVRGESPAGRGLTVVLRGRVMRQSAGFGLGGGVSCPFLEGDVWRGRWSSRGSMRNIGPEEAVLLVSPGLVPR